MRYKVDVIGVENKKLKDISREKAERIIEEHFAKGTGAWYQTALGRLKMIRLNPISDTYSTGGVAQ